MTCGIGQGYLLPTCVEREEDNVAEQKECGGRSVVVVCAAEVLLREEEKEE